MSSSVQAMAAPPPDRMVAQQSATPSRSTPTGEVDIPLTLSSRAFEQQYLRDLEMLERIEFQNECFFDAMGALHAERLEAHP
jgi:hypothetical protein